MDSKPATGDGYGSEDLALVRQVCFYLATKLGDILEDIAVVGGLAPSLSVDQDALLPSLPTLERETWIWPLPCRFYPQRDTKH